MGAKGVVTSAVVFSRNLGQSLGATLVGAIFNNSLNYQISRSDLLDLTSTEDLISFLNTPNLPLSSKLYLQEAINISMQHVYLGLTIFALIILICLYLVPHRNPRDAHLIDDSQ